MWGLGSFFVARISDLGLSQPTTHVTTVLQCLNSLKIYGVGTIEQPFTPHRCESVPWPVLGLRIPSRHRPFPLYNAWHYNLTRSSGGGVSTRDEVPRRHPPRVLEESSHLQPLQ